MAQIANQFDWMEFYKELSEKLLVYTEKIKAALSKPPTEEETGDSPSLWIHFGLPVSIFPLIFRNE